MNLNQALEIIRNGQCSLIEETKSALCDSRRKWKQVSNTSMQTKYAGINWLVHAVSETSLRIYLQDDDGAGAVIHATA